MFESETKVDSLNIPTRKGFLVRATNGQHLNVWLCTGTVHANNIIAKELDRLDPFVRGNLPIAWVDQDEEGTGTFSYSHRRDY